MDFQQSGYLTKWETEKLQKNLNAHLSKSFGVLRNPVEAMRVMQAEARQIIDDALDTMDAVIEDDDANEILRSVRVYYAESVPNEQATMMDSHVILECPGLKRLAINLETEYEYQPILTLHARGEEVYYFTEFERNAFLDGLYGRLDTFNQELATVAISPDRIDQVFTDFTASLHEALRSFKEVTEARYTDEFISDMRAIKQTAVLKAATLYSPHLADLLSTYKRS